MPDRSRRPERPMAVVTALGIVAMAVVGAVLIARTSFGADQAAGGDAVAPAPSEPRDVFVIGDSVTFLAAGNLELRFDRDHLQVLARPGFTSADLLPLARTAMAADAGPAATRQRVAVLVGYNDVRVRRLDTDALPALVRETSRFRCAVWLTVPARPGGVATTGAFVPSSLVDRWNHRLAEETDRYPNVHLAHDWQDAVTKAPVGTLLRADGVHPNRSGQRRLADAYRAAIDRSC